jgi:ATP-dependent Clp protease ATP-binding subunit ClpC
MFERYTEKARRVIFFARYEASQFGQPYIETEHLLLGLLREDKALANQFLRYDSVAAIRTQIERRTTIREKISTSVDLPLSDECKRVLAYAAEEAERLRHKHIGTEHLLLGLLREQGSFAQQLLAERGLELMKVRDELGKTAGERGISGSTLAAHGVNSLYTDLTEKAANGELDAVVGREIENDAMIEVLCRKERRNPMLLGGKGAGKRALVHALALRIAAGNVPPMLADTHVMALSPEALAAWHPSREKFGELAKLLGTPVQAHNLILFIDGLRGAPDGTKKVPGQELDGVLRFAMQESETLCIGTATEKEYQLACANYPELERLFRPLHVSPLNGEQTMVVLETRKQKLEQFHQVGFSEDALESAMQEADRYLKDHCLPGKALELLDATAAMVKILTHNPPLPEELSECRARLRLVAHRLKQATTNHEFDKAKFYSEELQKEEANLAALEEKHGIKTEAAPVVTRTEVEQMIAKWSAYPYSG